MGYKDIYERYKKGILSGNLKPGEKVPSIRVLAEDLGVAKKTVEAAYDILVGEGYLVSQGSRGTVVNPDLSIDTGNPQKVVNQLQDEDLKKIVDLRDNQGHFRLGIPSLDEFPYKKWLLLSGKVVRGMSLRDMAVPPVMGHRPLREAIVNYVRISRGLNCAPEQVFITSGYKSSLALILQALSTNNDKVVFEDPGYFFGQKLLKRIVLNLHYVPVDDNGLDIDYLVRVHGDAKFVITTPSHHSPTAVTLSLARRHQLLEWAQHNSAWVIEDDYDGEFHYTRKVVPALKSLDSQDRVIYVGTFSKTLMPSIRISYIVIPKSMILSFLEIGEIVATGLPLLPQKILAMFIAEGHFFKHLKKMRALYQQRRLIVVNALHKVYPGIFNVELTDGGMHVVAYLTKGTEDVKLSDIWQAHNLQVFPLSAWYAQNKKRYGLVVGYTNIRSEDEAINALKLPYVDTMALLGKPPHH
ncbi:MocR-like pyridoxine biosynthesis transcription factor PdxR [Halomonas sp. AOP12-C2-37]|uniref:MocR-like pyridoxine biosynthesis transcription factor PdxR n=1 Tax=unclassified Halomonas TaxID=2609666 RepID=UPI003F9301B2